MKWFDDVKKYYVYRALIKRFALPVIVLFMVNQGLSIEQIAIIAAVSKLISVVLEVPSGAIADSLGHRRALVIAALFQGLAMALYLGGTFWWIFAGSIVYWGLGTLMTGTLDALFYERVRELGRAKEYQKLEGRAVSVAHGLGIVAMALAGIAYAFAWWLPFAVGVLQFVLAAVVIGSFTQAKRPRSVAKFEGWMGWIHHFPVAWKALWTNKKLLWMTIANAVIVGSFFATAEFEPVILERASLAVVFFGFFYAGKRILAVPSAPLVHRLTSKVSAPMYIFVCGVFSALHILVVPMLHSAYTLVATFLVGTLMGIAMGIAVLDYSNQLIRGSSRATTLSFQNLSINLIQVGLIGIIGALGSVLAIEMTFGWIGFGTLLLVFTSCGMLARAYRA